MGNLFFADGVNRRYRKISPAGIITTFAGTGVPGYVGDNGPATDAQFYSPGYIAIDTQSNFFLLDAHYPVVRKVNAMGVISLFAGNYLTRGSTGDGGPATAALFNSTTEGGIVSDINGNIFVCDAGNNRVRKIDKTGIITTFAGNGISGYTGDGTPATNAELDPNGITVDGVGNVFISDRVHYNIRKVDISGTITTYAGTGVVGFFEDGGPATNAKLTLPGALAFATSGNLFFCDENRIRKVDRVGIIGTLAGGAGHGFSGDGGPATAADFFTPAGITVNYNCAENIYICDNNNGRIRMISYNHHPAFTGGHSQSLMVCEDAGATSINSLLMVIDSDLVQTNTWSVAGAPAHGSVAATYATGTTGTVLTPSGLTYTPATGFTGPDTFRVMVVDCSGIADTTTIYVTVNNCALVASPRPSPREREVLRVFPNPNNGTFTVRVSSGIDEDVRVVVSNMMGERVKEFNVRANEPVLVAIGMPAGVYFLSAVSSSGIWNERVVVR